MARHADSVPSGETASGSNQQRPLSAWKLALAFIALIPMLFVGPCLLIHLAWYLAFWEADVGYPVGSPPLLAAVVIYVLIGRWLIRQLAPLL